MHLPIRLFFALYRQGVKIEARQFRERLRIAKCASQNLDYFNALNDMYEAIIDPSKKELPKKPPGPCLELGTQEARHILQSVMTNVKRSMGYGR